MKRLVFALVGASLVCLASPAWAQDGVPYGPRKMSVSQVIKLDAFGSAPIVFDFDLVETTQVANGHRLDFRQKYNAKFADVVQYFDDAYHHHKPVGGLKGDAFPNAKKPELWVLGTSVSRGITRFTLGHADMPYRLIIDIEPGYDATIITIHNAIHSMQYSGVMPARAPFKPHGAKPIPFRGN